MSEFIMAHEYLWDEQQNIVEHLARQLIHGRLALVLGAGISSPFGLPDWETLIQKLYGVKNDTPDSSLTLEEQAEIFRSKYYKHDYDAFKLLVKEVLYETANCDFIDLHSNKTISAIGALVMSSFRGNVSNIITLNFDNLLEIYLKYYGYIVSSVYNEKHWNEKSDVSIYHPHGYLSYGQNGSSSKKLIFDQNSYLQVIGNRDNLWFQKVITILRSHTCIFIGLSGKDQNLNSLLHYTSENHAYEKERILYWGIRMTTETNENKIQLWKNKGVFSFILRDYLQHLPDFLFKICQTAAQMRQ